MGLFDLFKTRKKEFPKLVALGEYTNKYDVEIKELNGKIEAVIERLNKTSQ